MGEINFFPENLEIRDQKVILRLDLNVPIKNKSIDTKISQNFITAIFNLTPYSHLHFYF